MNLLRTLLRPAAALAAALLFLAAPVQAQHAGYRTITIAGDVPVTVALFYPTAVPDRVVPMGPWLPVVAPGAAASGARLKGLVLISHGTGLQGKQGVRNLEGGRRRKPLLRPRGVVNPHMFFAPTGIQDGDGAHSGRLRKKSRPFRAFRSHGQGRSGGAESQNRAGQKWFDFSHCRDFQESGESRATQINSRSTKK